MTRYFFLGIILSVIITGCGTPANIQSADEAFELQKYHTAAKMYEKLYKKQSTMEGRSAMAFKAAESYRLMNKWSEAENWYEQASALGYSDPLLNYRLGDVLKQQGKYESAQIQYETYKRERPGDPKANIGLESVSLYYQWKNDKARFVVEKNEELSSTENDYAPRFFAEGSKIFITSDRRGSTGDKIYERTGLQYSDIYKADRNMRKESWDKLEKVEGQINTDFNEGVVDFRETEEGYLMYYTQCNGPRGEESNCRILVAQRVGDTWMNPEPLPFCKDTSVNYGHPSLTRDGNTMYFASNMPGGYGQRDIYVTNYNPQKGTWSKPKNMGSSINSDGDEMFPFIYKDEVLYFASDGRPGIGGMDLFESTKEGENWSKARNLKPPVNSSADDISMIFDEQGDRGLFSSNREDEIDNIFSFYLKPKVCALQGKVVNVHNDKAIQNAEVTLYPKDKELEPVVIQTDKNGNFFFGEQFQCEFEYEVQATKEQFFASKREEVSSMEVEVSDTFDVKLTIEPYPITTIEIEGIYYGLDSSNLRKESLPVLDSLVNVLEENPTIVIELASHTDCRASMEYNDSLSLERARSVVNYLVRNGINQNRLVAEGYGERKLVNRCACENGQGVGINCTEEEHQQNRRTTFKILSTDFQPRRNNRGRNRGGGR